MTASANRISGADIVVPAARPAATPTAAPPVDIDFVLNRVRALLDGCATSDRNVLAAVAIEALIAAGVDTRPRIVGAARALGFNPAHAGVVLGKGGGRWRQEEGGAYRLTSD